MEARGLLWNSQKLPIKPKDQKIVQENSSVLGHSFLGDFALVET